MGNQLHQQVFEFLEKYRGEHPEFLYCSRERNRNNRLAEGLWFQGTETYAFVGLYDRNGGSNNTRSIGLVFSKNKINQISLGFQVVFNEEPDKKLISLYLDIVDSFGGFNKITDTRYDKILSEDNPFEVAKQFLNEKKPILDQKIKDAGLDKIFITQKKFNRNLEKIYQYQKALRQKENPMKFILANITWNSNKWKGLSDDPSNHGFVKGGGTPHESWNFDFDNKRNIGNEIRGYSKFTNSPKVEGDNNLVIFYSQNKIVGFYGKATIKNERESKDSNNLTGARNLSVGLDNYIENVKEKGYLEDKERVGRIGFIYLNEPDTIQQILHEALILNPLQANTLNAIRDWIGITEKPETNYWLFQGSTKIYDFHGAIAANALKSWSVKTHKKSIKKGDKVILWLTGNEPGCYALATISSNIFYRTDDHEEAEYYLEGKGLGEGDAVEIVIDRNLSQSPILWEDLKDLLEFSSFNAGTQGTNFTASKEQYETILNLINMANSEETPLNQIFFGPPGTGKTYHTIDEAVKIIDPEFYNQKKEDRKSLRKFYNDSKIKEWDGSGLGQIGFCTFHQSFSYEDFVEGIKPQLNTKSEVAKEEEKKEDTLKYVIEDGIFKKICRLADYHHKSAIEFKNLPENDFQKVTFWKVSLGEANNQADQEIYDYCSEKDLIALGFGSEIDFTGKNDSEVNEAYKELYPQGDGASMINYFKNWAKIGDYVVISKGNQFVRGIGKIAGDYFFDSEAPIRYKHFRKVEWLVKDEDIPVSELYNRKFRMHSIYKLDKDQIKQDFFVKGAGRVPEKKGSRKPKNFVLIIDEINRGNVSSIFGELITLIEKDKRASMNEEMEVVLPYSKKDFRVPPNLYIIGTMNTADRSIEALDTALRRRFSFREMSSKPDLLRTEGKIGKEKGGIIEGIDVVQMLQKINQRIEKLIDKDHRIGHAYFMEDTTKKDLQRTFKNKVIPLLEEYFFGDFGKIGLVLGSSFIGTDQAKEFDFADFKEYDPGITSDLKQRKVYKIKPMEEWDFQKIYSSK